MNNPSSSQLVQLLLSTPLFDGLNQDAIERIAGDLQYIYLQGGEYLFRQEDEADSLYVLIHGRLRAILEHEAEPIRVLGEVKRGESVGEMGLLTQHRRSASIQAIRDSELIRFSKKAFYHLIEKEPAAVLRFTRLIVARHQRSLKRTSNPTSVRSLVLVGATPDTHMRPFIPPILEAIARYGRVKWLQEKDMPAPSKDHAHSEWISFVHRLETDFDFLVYSCTGKTSSWSRFAISQADRILVLADATAGTADTCIVQIGTDDQLRQAVLALDYVPREVVIFHNAQTRRPSGTGRLQQQWGTIEHHHVIQDDMASFRRFARLIIGRGIGLVLSGGGARGLGHIGLLHAIQEAGIPIDHIGGTSMGAIIAGQIAAGIPIDDLVSINHKFFAKRRFMNDYTLPLHSLIRGRHYARIAQEVYGDWRIEDLWYNYFCVTSNLTKADLVVHRTGSAAETVRASAGLPGILPAVHYQGDMLVDGGVMNNLPIDVMKNMHRGWVVASNVSAVEAFEGSKQMNHLSLSGWKLAWQYLNPFIKTPKLPRVGEIIFRTAVLSSIKTVESVIDDADFYIGFDLSAFGTLEWKQIDTIIARAYEHAKPAVEQWITDCPELLD